MARSSNQGHFLRLRDEFPEFSFESASWKISAASIDIRFEFNLSGRLFFRPAIRIPVKSFFLPSSQYRDAMDTLVFHMGMIELISYWKATCSPGVIIKPFFLDPARIGWWKKLYFNGLGEFFYLNGIDCTLESFMDVSTTGDREPAPVQGPAGEGFIIPVGGGKDSAVTIDLLGRHAQAIPMIINPRKASLDTIFTAGFDRDQLFEIQRTIDPELLRLNDLGYLNGHTPFSAMLAFATLLAANVTGYRHIALSNESSASEATIPGTAINHQYSKSFEFEKDFREYTVRWISPRFDYFSFLRPLNELQIAALFARLPRYHPVFRSCNAGSKTDSWCGNCSKCLFTYIILSPFLKGEQLQQIFGKDLLADESLLPFFRQLTGMEDEKPFDCVGTIREVNLALCEAIRRNEGNGLPALLENFRRSSHFVQYDGVGFTDEIRQLAPGHFVAEDLMKILVGTTHADGGY